jgi:hypothetical protein
MLVPREKRAWAIADNAAVVLGAIGGHPFASPYPDKHPPLPGFRTVPEIHV